MGLGTAFHLSERGYRVTLLEKQKDVAKGTIHILRHHIFGIFGPPSPLRQHVFSTKNKQKLAFSDPLPPYKC